MVPYAVYSPIDKVLGGECASPDDIARWVSERVEGIDEGRAMKLIAGLASKGILKDRGDNCLYLDESWLEG